MPEEIFNFIQFLLNHYMYPYPTGSRAIGAGNESSDWDYVVNIPEDNTTDKALGVARVTQERKTFIYLSGLIHNYCEENKCKYKIFDNKTSYSTSLRVIINVFIKKKKYNRKVSNLFGLLNEYHKVQLICEGKEFDKWVLATEACAADPKAFSEKKYRVGMFRSCGVSQWSNDAT